LNHAATPGDGCPLVQQVNGNFGGRDRGEGGNYEGQVSEKKVHRSQKCGAEGDGNDNEQIGQQGNQENGQKDHEGYIPQVWNLSESQENKFSHIVGTHVEIHLRRNTLLGPEYLQKIKNDMSSTGKCYGLTFLKLESSHSVRSMSLADLPQSLFQFFLTFSTNYISSDT